MEAEKSLRVLVGRVVSDDTQGGHVVQNWPGFQVFHVVLAVVGSVPVDVLQLHRNQGFLWLVQRLFVVAHRLFQGVHPGLQPDVLESLFFVFVFFFENVFVFLLIKHAQRVIFVVFFICRNKNVPNIEASSFAVERNGIFERGVDFQLFNWVAMSRINLVHLYFAVNCRELEHSDFPKHISNQHQIRLFGMLVCAGDVVPLIKWEGWLCIIRVNMSVLMPLNIPGTSTCYVLGLIHIQVLQLHVVAVHDQVLAFNAPVNMAHWRGQACLNHYLLSWKTIRLNRNHFHVALTSSPTNRHLKVVWGKLNNWNEVVALPWGMLQSGKAGCFFIQNLVWEIVDKEDKAHTVADYN